MYLLIAAAGMGQRMGSNRNKLLLQLLGKPLLAWTLQSADCAETITQIGIIGQASDFPDFKTILTNLNLSKPVEFIQGGSTRQESVYNGLQSLPDNAKRVLIHDGARALVTPNLFNECGEVLKTNPGLVAAIRVKDTIKIVAQDQTIEATPERNRLWSAQTPQGFDVQLLKECHKKGRKLGWEVTDDSALFEKCKLPVKIVEGEETNLKITTPMDLAIAEFILQQRQKSMNPKL